MQEQAHDLLHPLVNTSKTNGEFGISKPREKESNNRLASQPSQRNDHDYPYIPEKSESKPECQRIHASFSNSN